MKKLNSLELNTLESSIKSKIEEIIEVGDRYNVLNGTGYSAAYIYGFQAIGNPGYLLKKEGEEFWKDLLTDCVCPGIWIRYNGERDFLIYIVKESVGYSNLMNLIENFKDEEGFHNENMDAFFRRYGKGE